jgi:hypothetical protein
MEKLLHGDGAKGPQDLSFSFAIIGLEVAAKLLLLYDKSHRPAGVSCCVRVLSH